MIKINKIYNEDNLVTMNRMSDKFVSGLITSPPYNICGKRTDCYYNNGYSDNDSLTEDEYISIRINEFKEFERILKDDGVICYNISYHNENPILPTLLVAEVHKQTSLTIADIIIWRKNHAIPFQTSGTKLSRICELIYVFVKKDHLHTFKTNKEISKVNERTGQNFYKNYTNIIEAANNDGFKSNLKASYSSELVEKLIFIYFPEGSLIYDPFSGIGSTAKGCINKKCDFIASERIEEFYEDSKKYLNKNEL